MEHGLQEVKDRSSKGVMVRVQERGGRSQIGLAGGNFCTWQQVRREDKGEELRATGISGSAREGRDAWGR